MRVLALALLFALPAHAGPLDILRRATVNTADWTKHHKRFLAMEAAAVGPSAFEVAAVNRCVRRNGQDGCLARYGARDATLGMHVGFSTVVFPAIAEACWQHTDDSHWCDPLGFAFPAGQTIFAIQQWRQRDEKHNDWPKSDRPDLHSDAYTLR